MYRLEVDLFDPVPDPDLVCAICQCVLLDPTEATPCRHVFCQECIATWLGGGARTCPTCRGVLTIGDLRRALPLICNVIGRLMMKCTNSAAGCEVRLAVERLDSHLRDDCQWVAEACQCGVQVLRRDRAEHEQICDSCLVQCSGACGMMIRASDRLNHDCCDSLKQAVADLHNMLDELKQRLDRLQARNQRLAKQLQDYGHTVIADDENSVPAESSTNRSQYPVDSLIQFDQFLHSPAAVSDVSVHWHEDASLDTVLEDENQSLSQHSISDNVSDDEVSASESEVPPYRIPRHSSPVDSHFDADRHSSRGSSRTQFVGGWASARNLRSLPHRQRSSSEVANDEAARDFADSDTQTSSGPSTSHYARVMHNAARRMSAASPPNHIMVRLRLMERRHPGNQVLGQTSLGDITGPPSRLQDDMSPSSHVSYQDEDDGEHSWSYQASDRSPVNDRDYHNVRSDDEQSIHTYNSPRSRASSVERSFRSRSPFTTSPDYSAQFSNSPYSDGRRSHRSRNSPDINCTRRSRDGSSYQSSASSSPSFRRSPSIDDAESRYSRGSVDHTRSSSGGWDSDYSRHSNSRHSEEDTSERYGNTYSPHNVYARSPSISSRSRDMEYSRSDRRYRDTSQELSERDSDDEEESHHAARSRHSSGSSLDDRYSVHRPADDVESSVRHHTTSDYSRSHSDQSAHDSGHHSDSRHTDSLPLLDSDHAGHVPQRHSPRGVKRHRSPGSDSYDDRHKMPRR